MAILAISLSMAFAQTTSAQFGIPQPEKTVGYISVAPTLIGVGQTLTCKPMGLSSTYNEYLLSADYYTAFTV